MSERPQPDAATDEDLVAAFRRDPRGHDGRAAAGELIERWSGRVYGWAFRVVRERELALDLAQDCLLKMYEALPRYLSRGRFSAWLFTIVHHRCVSEVRKRPLRFDPEVDTDSLLSQGPDPANEIENDDERTRVLDAMEQALDTEERTALWLRGWEGMSVEEITRIMNLEGASGGRALLQRARRKLREAIERPRASGGMEP